MVATGGIQNGKRWKLAPCLNALFIETDARYPGRLTISDGTIGDAAHASRKSDHNPDDGWVDAGDLTDDKRSGCDADLLARHLVASRDPRVSYVIWNGTIVKSYGSNAWKAIVYTGTNPHDKHTHISVLDSARNATGPWWPGGDNDMADLQPIIDKLAAIELRVIELDDDIPENLNDQLGELRRNVRRIGKEVNAKGIEGSVPEYP